MIDGIQPIRTNQDGDSSDDTFTVLLDTEHPDRPDRVEAGSPSSVRITITDDDLRPAGPPGAPRDLRATEGDARLDLAWKPPAAGAVTGYDVHYTLLGTLA